MSVLSVYGTLHHIIGIRRNFFRFHVNHKTVLDIILLQTSEGFVYLINTNQLYLSRNMMLRTEINHLLCFGNTANIGTGETFAAIYNIECTDFKRLVRKTN